MRVYIYGQFSLSNDSEETTPPHHITRLPGPSASCVQSSISQPRALPCLVIYPNANAHASGYKEN